MPHLLWHGASDFPVSSEGSPHLIASYDLQGDAEELFLPGSSRVSIQSPHTTRKGMLRIYSYPGPHGVQELHHHRQDLSLGLKQSINLSWIVEPSYQQSLRKPASIRFLGKISAPP
jgi:hypothetical protein